MALESYRVYAETKILAMKQDSPAEVAQKSALRWSGYSQDGNPMAIGDMVQKAMEKPENEVDDEGDLLEMLVFPNFPWAIRVEFTPPTQHWRWKDLLTFSIQPEDVSWDGKLTSHVTVGPPMTHTYHLVGVVKSRKAPGGTDKVRVYNLTGEMLDTLARPMTCLDNEWRLGEPGHVYSLYYVRAVGFGYPAWVHEVGEDPPEAKEVWDLVDKIANKHKESVRSKFEEYGLSEWIAARAIVPQDTVGIMARPTRPVAPPEQAPAAAGSPSSTAKGSSKRRADSPPRPARGEPPSQRPRKDNRASSPGPVWPGRSGNNQRTNNNVEDRHNTRQSYDSPDLTAEATSSVAQGVEEAAGLAARDAEEGREPALQPEQARCGQM